jgi:hypothetical protein
MKPIKCFLAIFFAAMVLAGCAYRYYLGMHGPSVRRHVEIHAGIRMDKECLECHTSSNNPGVPATNHPQFTGCLKCHNDALVEKKSSSLQ